MASQQINDETNLELNKKSEGASITVLQSILADTIFMHSLYKKYHWHVEGEDFYQYHLLFDKHANELLPLIDLVAERIRTLGGIAPGLPAEVERNKQVNEGADPGPSGQKMLHNLLSAHESALKNIRSGIRISEKYEDDGTNDLLVSDALRLQELQAWFIRSSLANKQ
jgi:starvation-inducible DNA-binding protein